MHFLQRPRSKNDFKGSLTVLTTTLKWLTQGIETSDVIMIPVLGLYGVNPVIK